MLADRARVRFGVGCLATSLALPFAAACRPPAASPETRGESWLVTGALRSNACAPGLEPIDPLLFGAEIRRESGIAYWRLGEQPWVPGSLDAAGNFRFTSRTDVELYPPSRGTDPELDPGTPGCRVSMIETIEGTFDGAPPVDAPAADAGVSNDAASSDGGAPDGGASSSATFMATSRIELVPQAGFECSRALLAQGGVFPSLPCAAEYALSGSRP
jgi:hypothetical protein